VAEREVAKLIKAWWNRFEPESLFIRTPLSGGWSDEETRREFKATGDLMTNSPSFPFDVEVKRREGWSENTFLAGQPCPVWGWWQQTQRASWVSRREPMLWFRHNRRPWMVLLRDCYVSGLFLGRKVESLPPSICSQCIKPVGNGCVCTVPRFGSGTLGKPFATWGQELMAVNYGGYLPVCFMAHDIMLIHPLRFIRGSEQTPTGPPSACPVCGADSTRVRGKPHTYRRCSKSCGWHWGDEEIPSRNPFT